MNSANVRRGQFTFQMRSSYSCCVFIFTFHIFDARIKLASIASMIARDIHRKVRLLKVHHIDSCFRAVIGLARSSLVVHGRAFFGVSMGHLYGGRLAMGGRSAFNFVQLAG